MLQLVEVAEFLTKQLNLIGEQQKPAYKFTIYAEVGANKDNGTIQGVLKSNAPTLLPVANVKNAKYSLYVEMSVPAPTTNYNLKNIENIIGLTVNEINGKEFEFGNGKGLITLTLTSTGSFKTEFAQGNIVPLKLNVDVNYTENVITSASKVWLLDDMRIPYTMESVIIEKNGKTSPIAGENYQKTFMTTQMKFYHFVFPYEIENTLCSMLQKDILQGSANKTYTLKYYDGVSFKEDDPFTTTVSIFRNADTRANASDTAIFDLTFADVDNGKSQTKYYLALIDNDFDDQAENTRYFEATETKTALQVQRDYYQYKINNGGAKFEEIKAPNLDDLVITNQVYRNENKYDLFDLVNKNYAIIKVVRPNGNEKWYYYWCHNRIGSENQIYCDLKLDSIQTEYFNPNLKFNGTLIQNAHIDRWIDNGDGTYSFNMKSDSKLFEREELKNVAMRLKERSKMTYNYTRPENNELIDWLNENVEAWVYIVLKQKESWNYNYYDLDTKGVVQKTSRLQNTYIENNGVVKLHYPYTTIVYPIYNTRESDKVILPQIKFSLIGDFNFLGNAVFDFNHSSLTIQKDITEWFKRNFNREPQVNDCIFVLRFADKTPVNEYVYYNAENVWTGYTEFYETPQALSESVANSFIELNSGFDNVYSIKVSMKPPIILDSVIGYYKKESETNIFLYDTLFLTATEGFGGEFKINGQNVYGGTSPILQYVNDYTSPTKLKTNLNMPRLKFEAKEIVGDGQTFDNLNIDKKLNPKLNSSDYKALRITYAGGMQEFPIDKLNTENPIFDYIEQITADCSKILIRPYFDNNNGIFNLDYSKSFNGLNFTNDFSMPYATNQLETYLANNKNAYLSFQAQQQNAQKQLQITNDYSRYSTVASGATSVLQTIAQMASGDVAGGIGTAIGLAGQVAQTELGIGQRNAQLSQQQSFERTQFNLSLDNMKNAPETLTNANGGVLFTMAVAKFGVYAELYEGLDNELEIANSMMNMNGYIYNQYGNPRDFDSIRRRFNYIKANVGSLDGVPISNLIRTDIRQRFANGIRFWRQGIDIDYTKENYEISIFNPIS